MIVRSHKEKRYKIIGICVWAAIGALAVFAAVRAAHGQEPPKLAAPPAIPMETQNRLYKAQLEQAKMVIDLKNTIEQYNRLQAALAAQAKEVDKLKSDALAAAKLDPAQYDVDLERMAFVPKPQPSKPSEPASPPAKDK